MVVTEKDECQHGTTVVTMSQTAGRGRLGRSWFAPPGKTLAISVLLHPSALFAPESFGWLPLIAGLAMTRAVQEFARGSASSVRVGLKWPNDVLVNDRKVCGILCEQSPDGSVIVGAGLNLSLDLAELPTVHSSALLLETGTLPDPDTVLADYLSQLLELCQLLDIANGDAVASGILPQVRAACQTIGSLVRVELSGGKSLFGVAEGLDENGRLSLRSADGTQRVVTAGDVIHVRRAV